ncbi:LOW QUALITY PROTEIN: ras-related protein Rab-4B [Melopsittacus undulatus]|nr:LOW QUALITY PROTEIN: ras-related protein Rab-4B [Melopsittacus undulatus]
MSETYDFLFKFLVIGSAGTGKSCLLHQFIENKFKQDSNHTIGVEFGSKVVNVGGKTVKLQIWDTAGQERFRSVTRSYYRGAAGALLVYDITSRETYNALTNWLTDARTLASPNIVIILCGNKKDLDAEREVTFLEASRFAQENELMFLETSALTGENVEEAFLKCAREILNKIESGELDPERMGSGIQFGDASLRQLRQPRGGAAPHRPELRLLSAVFPPCRPPPSRITPGFPLGSPPPLSLLHPDAAPPNNPMGGVGLYHYGGA